MRIVSTLSGFFLASLVVAQTTTPTASPTPEPTATPIPKRQLEIQSSINRHLGKPYVWGACGLKSYDCSGFLWRVMWENGIFIKRTTARKFYVSLPIITNEKQYEFPALVFFDDLEHVGIVRSKESFFHSSLTRGTHESKFDPYWRSKIYGFRLMPLPPVIDTIETPPASVDAQPQATAVPGTVNLPTPTPTPTT